MFATECCPEAPLDLVASILAVPQGFAPVTLSPESVHFPAVLLDPQALGLGAALTVVLAPMRRLFPRTQRMQEWPV